MNHTIEGMIDRYDSGDLDRRQLIQGLAAMAVGGCALQDRPTSVMRGNSLNHVSLAVTDVERSHRFYEHLLGLQVVSRQDNGVNLGLGTSFLGLYDIPGTPRVHHPSIGVDDFDLEDVAQKLRNNGLEPSFNRGVEVYFRDPDGILIQLSAKDYRG